MKNYITIAILGLFFCNSALALSFGAPPVIPIDEKQAEKQAQEEQEAVTNIINQNHKRLEEKHYCLSFNFVRESGVITKFLIYECKECGQQVQILPPNTIEDKIADNKRRMELEKMVLDFGNIRNELNQQNPKTTSKPKGTPTSKPKGTPTSKPSTTTKKPQTNLDIPSVNSSSSKVAVEQPKPTAEENLEKISDGIDAAIDMVKKIQTNANKSKSINSEKIEKNRQIAQELNSISDVNPEDPIDHPFKSLEEARSVAYEMMAQKMKGDGTIEYSTGIVKVFDPHFGDRYYIQRIIEGNNKTVMTATVNEEAWYTQDSMTGELEVLRPKKVTIERIHSHPKGSVIEPSMGDYKNVINTSNKVKENVSSVIFGFDKDNVSNQALIFYPDGRYSELEYNGDWKAVNPNANTQYLGEKCDDIERALYVAGKTGFHGAPCPLEGDKTPSNDNNSASSKPKNLVFGK